MAHGGQGVTRTRGATCFGHAILIRNLSRVLAIRGWRLWKIPAGASDISANRFCTLRSPGRS
eukprot:5445693-Pyramimonas_sp.AAC.1